METRKIHFRIRTLIGQMKDTGKPCSLEIIASETGLDASNLSLLASNKTRMVRLKTIELLCAFFECGLSDLMVLE
jgi:DNA-binding Xre family transcriptional regulator